MQYENEMCSGAQDCNEDLATSFKAHKPEDQGLEKNASSWERHDWRRQTEFQADVEHRICPGCGAHRPMSIDP